MDEDKKACPQAKLDNLKVLDKEADKGEYQTPLYGQLPMKPLPSEYHFVILPGTAEPRRFTVKRRTVRVLLVIFLLAVILQVAFLVHYVAHSGEMWELQALRAQQQQTTAVSSAMQDLRKQLSAIREMNNRLRIMLGLDPPKPVSTNPGVGGTEESQVGPSPDGAGDERQASSGTAAQLQQELSWLSHEVKAQEQHLEELKGIVSARREQWAATPSIWPVRGWLSSAFGPRVSPFTGTTMMHGGVDISAPMETPIVAPASGTVTLAAREAGLGNALVVSHGYGLRTVYGHLSKIKVKAGQRVKRGDLLGLVGSTGLSTGPHLHYEVQVDGRLVNPLKYIIE